MLSLLIFCPIIVAVFIYLFKNTPSKHIATVLVFVHFLASMYVVWSYSGAGYQWVEDNPWFQLDLGQFGQINIKYILGVDGLSIWFLPLTDIVFLAAILLSSEITQQIRGFYALVLILLGTVFGCFLSLDFFLFFLFFEFMLLPMFFLIGIWGGANREYASLKFFIYTLVGSVFILVVMIALGFSAVDMLASMNVGKSVHTLDFRLLAERKNYLPDAPLLQPFYQKWAFGLLVLGFLIKLPAVPVHTWLPDAHVEAPTPVSIILAGILLKIGGYGMIRVAYDFFPEAAVHFSTVLGGIGLVSIIYGGYAALGQIDLKKMVAYSSVSHMGFVLIGVASLTKEGLNGAVYQMISHGVLSAMLFGLVGVLYSRTHDRRIDNYRGLAAKMPLFTFFTAIGFFASMGLPGFSGFVGEFFSIWGSFKSDYFPVYFGFIATAGIVLSATYFLLVFQKMFFGSFWANANYAENLSPLTKTEILVFAMLSLLSLILGLYPNLILNLTENSLGF